MSNGFEDKIHHLVQETLREWNIPGLGLALVHQGQIKIANGYGIRKLGFEEKVDKHTLFQIASLSKAFTGYAVSLLVEQGKLQWEQPILNWLPHFRLKDPIATEQMTLRDLLSHRTGLPGVSQEEARRFWHHTDRSTDELIRRLAHVEPFCPFRAHFGYNDMPYVVAGEIVNKVTGIPIQDFYRDHIFIPLKMNRTTTSHAFQCKDSNAASGHLVQTGGQPIPLQNLENVLATAGISSCAEDMAQWLQYNLDPSPALFKTHQPQTLFEVDGFMNTSSRPIWKIFTHDQEILNYSLGWMIYTLNNRTVLFHPGLSDGMQPVIAFIPEEKLGIGIFTNLAFHYGALCLLNEIFDLIFSINNTKSWHQKAKSSLSIITINVQSEHDKIAFMRQKEAHHALPLHQYTGKYDHPAYGSVSITIDQEVLKVALFGQEKGQLKHIQNEEFEIVGTLYQPPLPWIVVFDLQEQSVKGLRMEGFGVFLKISYTGNVSRIDYQGASKPRD